MLNWIRRLLTRLPHRRFVRSLRRLSPVQRWGAIAALQLFLILSLVWHWPPVQLTLLVPAAESAYWMDLATLFETEQQEIRVRVTPLDDSQGDLTDRLRQVCSLSPSPCDLFYLDVIWVPELAADGVLRDLSAKVTEAQLDAFLAPAVAAGRYGQGLYRIPFRSDIGLLYYRTDLLAAAGYEPPETFADLLTTSQALQAAGQVEWGYLWQGQEDEGLVAMFVEVLRGHGGFWIDPVTQAVGLDQPAAIAAAQFLIQTIESGVSPPAVLLDSEAESLAQFKQGNVLFLRNWPEAWSDLKQSDLGDRVAFKPIQLHQPGIEGAACDGSWGFGIHRESEHVGAAWRAIQYFTSEAAQAQLMDQTSLLPSRRSLLESQFPDLLPLMERPVSRPQVPQAPAQQPRYSDLSKILQRHLSRGLSRPDQLELELQLAAEETRAAIAQQT